MTFRVSQRAQARHDILELVAYIATEDPKAAAALYDAYERILATTLATTPDIGRPYDEVEVLRVLRGARDIRSNLGADQPYPNPLRCCAPTPSAARALLLALLESLCLREFRELRLGRAQRQPELAEALDEEVLLLLPTKHPQPSFSHNSADAFSYLATKAVLASSASARSRKA
jgi:plasmid stabilization system protein ParE